MLLYWPGPATLTVVGYKDSAVYLTGTRWWHCWKKEIAMVGW